MRTLANSRMTVFSIGTLCAVVVLACPLQTGNPYAFTISRVRFDFMMYFITLIVYARGSARRGKSAWKLPVKELSAIMDSKPNQPTAIPSTWNNGHPYPYMRRLGTSPQIGSECCTFESLFLTAYGSPYPMQPHPYYAGTPYPGYPLPAPNMFPVQPTPQPGTPSAPPQIDTEAVQNGDVPPNP
ncbi:hypothetical protein BJ138DRAFT_1124288 [Hygrophoropsis aurantiaca]|uniref:Uncharacterized protein n=1 Tax=Hygrophoropsis aurantiaca TaxID=72124 RepID=A0ACB8AK01_9AGAM|nr:hypothetical protein BJ138DRAFT_1124288 [Hygrophoropsis aurantiaca]